MTTISFEAASGIDLDNPVAIVLRADADGHINASAHGHESMMLDLAENIVAMVNSSDTGEFENIIDSVSTETPEDADEVAAMRAAKANKATPKQKARRKDLLQLRLDLRTEIQEIEDKIKPDIENAKNDKIKVELTKKMRNKIFKARRLANREMRAIRKDL